MKDALCRLIPFGLALAALIAPRGAAAEADPSPCEETSCANSCESAAAAFADPQTQPARPPIGAQARCIEVMLPTADDACVYEKHAACDCAASGTPQGGNVVTQGLPEFGVLGDAPDEACTRLSFLPNSCLLRGSETHCDIAGDGADCTAVCDLLRTRMGEEAARASGVTVDGARCATSTACACVFRLDGKCAFMNDGVACGTDPASAYGQWLASERAKPVPKACFQGGCLACVVSGAAPEGTDTGAIAAATLGCALLLVRRRDRARAGDWRA